MRSRSKLFLGLACALVTSSSALAEPVIGPNTTGTPQIIVRDVKGTPGETALIKQAVDLANRVMASRCFADHVRHGVFTENRDLTSEQIWQQLSTTTVALHVIFYKGSLRANYWSKTIGYENEDRPDISFMNRHFVRTAACAASNMIHEGEGHSQGFRHDGEKWSSVPYQLNNFYEACAASVGAPTCQ